MMDHIPDNEDVNKPLSDKEAAFAVSWLETRSIAMAAKDVGISRNTAYEYKKRPHVAAEIAKLEAESVARACVTNEWLIEQIKETALLAKRAQNFNAALNGFKTLAQINGMFDEVDNGVTYNMMGAVIIAKDSESAKKLLDNPNKPIDGEYEVLDFQIGEEVNE